MMLLNIRYKKLGLFRSSYKIDNCQQWNENTANLNVLNKSNWENNVCRKYSKTRCLNRTGEIEGTFSCDTQTWIQEFQKCSLYSILKIDQIRVKEIGLIFWFSLSLSILVNL